MTHEELKDKEQLFATRIAKRDELEQLKLSEFIVYDQTLLMDGTHRKETVINCVYALKSARGNAHLIFNEDCSEFKGHLGNLSISGYLDKGFDNKQKERKYKKNMPKRVKVTTPDGKRPFYDATFETQMWGEIHFGRAREAHSSYGYDFLISNWDHNVQLKRPLYFCKSLKALLNILLNPLYWLK